MAESQDGGSLLALYFPSDDYRSGPEMGSSSNVIQHPRLNLESQVWGAETWPGYVPLGRPDRLGPCQWLSGLSRQMYCTQLGSSGDPDVA